MEDPILSRIQCSYPGEIITPQDLHLVLCLLQFPHPQQELLTVQGGSHYTLTIPFSVPFPEMYVNEYTVKVILPEWARNIDVNLPFEAQEVSNRVHKMVGPMNNPSIHPSIRMLTHICIYTHIPTRTQSRTSRLTFLDTSLSGGRPVIILKKTNTVAEHNQPLIVSYDFNRSAMLLEPFYLVAAFLAFYIICMIFVRVDLTIKPTGSPSSADKEKKTL